MTQSMRMRVELISKYSPKPPHIPNSILSVSDLYNFFDILQSTPFIANYILLFYMEIYEETMRLYDIFLGDSHINCLNFQLILKL